MYRFRVLDFFFFFMLNIRKNFDRYATDRQISNTVDARLSQNIQQPLINETSLEVLIDNEPSYAGIPQQIEMRPYNADITKIEKRIKPIYLLHYD